MGDTPGKIPRRSQQERREEAENALLDAAQELIAEQGIMRTSLAQIAARAGYSHGLVNHHFGSKDQLIEQLVNRGRQRFMNRSIGARSDDGLHRLLKAVDTFLSPFDSPNTRTPYLLVMWGSSLPAGASHRATMAEFEAGARQIARRTVLLGQEDGSISKDVDPDSFATVFMGLMRGCAAQILLKPNRIKPRKLRQQIKQYIENALAP